MKFIEFEPILNFANAKNTLNSEIIENKNENSFSPKIDIFEDEKNIYLEAEIPGLNKNEIKIKLVNNRLTISGEKRNRNFEKGKLIYNERVFGFFKREFEINSEIDRKNLNASFENGILKITFGKLIPRKNERTIEIN
ncbi:MAG TPA: Hsp20/alpha crystallin family protein [Ignavibacteriaceae bacterium]|nr:Hsp20/alpha crystallin family protein [Ignavibacteriaceae bacterium]